MVVDTASWLQDHWSNKKSLPFPDSFSVYQLREEKHAIFGTGPHFGYLQQTFNSKMESSGVTNFVKVYSDNLFAVSQPSNKPESTEFKNRVLSLFEEQHETLLCAQILTDITAMKPC